jgi:hypothetical protein
MRGGSLERTGGLQDAQLENLARIVPLVSCVGDVQAFIALEANQVRLEGRRDRAGQRGLADTGLSFEEQRTPQSKRQEQRHRQPAIRDVAVERQPLLQIGDGPLENRRAPLPQARPECGG